MLNKVKHFAWRAYNNALPTMSNLAYQHISTFDLCEQCKAAPKDTIHALWACKELEGVWGSLSWARPTSLACPQNFDDLLDCFLQVQEDYRKELFIMVAWAVWNHRNSLKFGHPTVAVDGISSKASAMLQEFLSVQASPVIAPTTAALHQWRPSKYPFFKANFDVAVFKTSSSAGFGVIIRDGMGEAIGALIMPIPLANSVATTEALALGMTTGRVRARFLYARTRHAGLSQKPEPARLINGFFSYAPYLPRWAPRAPPSPLHFRAQSVAQSKKKKKKGCLKP